MHLRAKFWDLCPDINNKKDFFAKTPNIYRNTLYGIKIQEPKNKCMH